MDFMSYLADTSPSMCQATCLTAWHGVVQAEAASHAGKVRDRRQALEEAASTSARATQVGILLVQLPSCKQPRPFHHPSVLLYAAGLIVLRSFPS